jgi:beta-lactamase superfamily II metal-dependent hydrolase
MDEHDVPMHFASKSNRRVVNKRDGMEVFEMRIHLLPAAHGDCLLVEYGDKPVHRILIDGGVKSTYESLRERFLAMAENDRRLDLLVVSHVDADHIEGIVRMLTDDTIPIRIGDLWFNGHQHLNEAAPVDFGGVQGEYLSALIQKRQLQWNAATKGRAVCVPEQGPLPVFKLPGGMTLTLLSPSPRKLVKMADAWEDDVRKAGLDPEHPVQALEHLETKGKRLIARFDEDEGPDVEALAAASYTGDTAPANGASIAFLAEYKDKRVLFCADAHSDVLEDSVGRLLRVRKQRTLEVDVFKLPHHGSRANLSPRFVEMIRARKVLVSTSGAIFEHPDAEAIARIVKKRWNCEFVFNYRSEENEIWDHVATKQAYGYTTRYPTEKKSVVTVDLD